LKSACVGDLSIIELKNAWGDIKKKSVLVYYNTVGFLCLKNNL